MADNNNGSNINDEAATANAALAAAVAAAQAEATLADAAWDTYPEDTNINGIGDTRRDYEKRRKLMQTSIDANDRLLEVQNKSKRAKLADCDGRGSYLMMPGMDSPRIIISSFLDNCSRINLLLTSKKMKNQYYAHRNNNNNDDGMKIVPTMYINPSRNEGNGRNMFVTNWRAKYRNRNNNGLNDRLPSFTRMVVNDLNEYNQYDYAFEMLQHRIEEHCPMEFIQDLDLSSLPDSADDVCANFPCNLSVLVPNILHLNLSNTKFNNIIVQQRERREGGADMKYRNEILEVYTQHCNRLEKITWNNNYDYDTRHTHRYEKGCIQLNGYEMRGGNNAHHLSNIEMNDCIFVVLSNDRIVPQFLHQFVPTVNIVKNDVQNDVRFHPIADLILNNHNDIFMFHYCCNGLERVSIKNARYRDYEDGQEMIRLLPQTVLIKFARNAPRLRYFRSDLTQANIMMLRMEKPEIEFVSN